MVRQILLDDLTDFINPFSLTPQEAYWREEGQAPCLPAVSDGRVHRQPHGDGEAAQGRPEEEGKGGEEESGEWEDWEEQNLINVSHYVGITKENLNLFPLKTVLP